MHIVPPVKNAQTQFLNHGDGGVAFFVILSYCFFETLINFTSCFLCYFVRKMTIYELFGQDKVMIEIKNMTKIYRSGVKALDDISFTVADGELAAIIGRSGSGKSTLVDLLPRFWDVNEGEICIDGINIKDVTLHDLRSLMGNVNQEAILFNDSFFNNIAFGVENATMEQVIEAAKIANAHDFITATEQGYHSNIGDRGCKLSGGQRQRISIARAILKNPPILILDEATSALDTTSEKLVQEALENLMKSRTTIVIAHRLSTIYNADRIYVIFLSI